MKKLLVTLLFVSLALGTQLGTQAAHAQATIELGPTVGYGFSNLEAASVGADARIGLGALPVALNPTFDYFFVEDTENASTTLFQITGNAIYEFEIGAEQPFVPYAGAGVSYLRTSTEASGGGVTVNASDSEVGLNLLGGAKFNVGAIKPFAQVRYTTVGDGLFSINGGILFGF